MPSVSRNPRVLTKAGRTAPGIIFDDKCVKNGILQREAAQNAHFWSGKRPEIRENFSFPKTSFRSLTNPQVCQRSDKPELQNQTCRVLTKVGRAALGIIYDDKCVKNGILQREAAQNADFWSGKRPEIRENFSFPKLSFRSLTNSQVCQRPGRGWESLQVEESNLQARART